MKLKQTVSLRVSDPQQFTKSPRHQSDTVPPNRRPVRVGAGCANKLILSLATLLALVGSSAQAENFTVFATGCILTLPPA
jgi:hypothetical protein